MMRLLTVLALTLTLSAPPVVQAHLQKDTMACFGIKSAKKVSESIVDSNGMLLERYDTDGDRKADFATLSHVLGTDDKITTHNKRPVFFMTRGAQKVYIDKMGDGKCKDIVLYHDETKPHDKGLMTQWLRMPMDEGKGI